MKKTTSSTEVFKSRKHSFSTPLSPFGGKKHSFSTSDFPWHDLDNLGYRGPHSLERVWTYLEDDALFEAYLKMGGAVHCYFSEWGHPLKTALQEWNAHRSILLMEHGSDPAQLVIDHPNHWRKSCLNPLWFSITASLDPWGDPPQDGLPLILNELKARGVDFHQKNELGYSIFPEIWLGYEQGWKERSTGYQNRVLYLSHLLFQHEFSINPEEKEIILNLFSEQNFDGKDFFEASFLSEYFKQTFKPADAPKSKAQRRI